MSTGLFVNLPNETFHLRIHVVDESEGTAVFCGQIGEEKRYVECSIDIPEWELVGLLADAYLDEKE